MMDELASSLEVNGPRTDWPKWYTDTLFVNLPDAEQAMAYLRLNPRDSALAHTLLASQNRGDPSGPQQNHSHARGATTHILRLQRKAGTAKSLANPRTGI